MANRHQLIVYTDLDGTLLDGLTYSWEKVLPAVARLSTGNIPIIFCSAKTRAEQEVYRQKLKLYYPFIVENGAAIFIPCHYFPFQFGFDKKDALFYIIESGIPYAQIRETLHKIKRENNFSFTGFGDMSVDEVAFETGLDTAAAELAKQREYSETLKFYDTAETCEALEKIRQAGLEVSHGGRFYNVTGAGNKGNSVLVLNSLYRRLFLRIKTIGIGDSTNDFPMLEVVDEPYLVQKPDGSWENLSVIKLCKIPGIGPEGWHKVAEMITQ